MVSFGSFFFAKRKISLIVFLLSMSLNKKAASLFKTEIPFSDKGL